MFIDDSCYYLCSKQSVGLPNIGLFIAHSELPLTPYLFCALQQYEAF